MYIGAFIFVALGVLSMLSYQEEHSRELALEKAAADSSNLAWVLEASLNATLRRLDTDLVEIARTAVSNDLRQTDLPAQHTRWTDYLERFKAKFPEVTDFFVFDADGQMLFASNGTIKPFNIADRRHFQKLRDDATVGLLLSDVVISRIDDRPTAIFGRALRAPDGRFLGIASALLDFQHWQTIFSALDIGAHGVIALRRSDTHQLILRRPERPDEYNKSVDIALTRRVSAGERVGVERFASPLDGITRVVSYRVLEDYPIYVNVAIADHDALAAWRRQGIVATLSVAGILFGFGLLLMRLWRAELRRIASLDELARSEQQVRELAYYDPLTNLANRRLLLERLTLGLSQAKRFRRSLALMFLDLDGFKVINDTFGHEVGDGLLKEVAVRLTGCVRTGDTISRQGGDEFIVVLTEIAQPSDASGVADKVLEVLGTPYRIAGQELLVTTSIGIAVYPIDGVDDVRELMKKADQAMYAAKAAGRNGYKFFEGDDTAES
ncbi:regulatory protein [Methylogaea oryzae]|uniref:Regulatory protein n=2 Tax=Methylogaea oryzae TaxID=1295382 RepID=A0A8D4VMG9_9GAMM|nr:regulatory protein [Methylogaea oryzae]